MERRGLLPVLNVSLLTGFTASNSRWWADPCCVYEPECIRESLLVSDQPRPTGRRTCDAVCLAWGYL